MKTSNQLTLSTSPLSQPTRNPCGAVSLTHRQWLLYGRKRRYPTGKERDSETGLHYYGARYLDGRTGRWISGDPAVEEYVPEAPVDGEARKRNGNLPGMGGVFNYANLHVYHYAGNNPVKYVDPSGMWLDNEDGTFTAEKGDTLWDLYGADWQEKSGYTGDPTKLQIGDVVGIKNKTDIFSNDELTQSSDLNNLTKNSLSGTLFFGIEIDLVAIFGLEISVFTAIDFNDPLNSGINFSGGLAAGANVGVARCIGYVRGSLEGRMPLGVDINLGRLPISIAMMTDNNGISGGSVGLGPGIGLSVTSQNAWTLSPRKLINSARGWSK